MARTDRRWRSRADSSLLLATVLWIADRLRRPLTLLGVDFPTFREALRIRFVLELRSTPGGAMGGMSGMADLALVMTLLMFWMTGLGAGILGLVADDPMLWIGISQGGLMALVALVLLGQYVHTLVDDTDIAVIAHHPVPDATLYAVRVAHLFVYAGMCAALFALGGTFLGLFGQHPVASLLLYPLVTVLSTILVVGLVAILFALVLWVFGAERYRRITLWLQIALLTAMFGGGQLIAPLVREVGALDGPPPPELLALLPPVHMAGLFLVFTGSPTPEHLAYAVLAVALPVLSLWATLRLAARNFIAGLSGSVELGRTPRRGWRAGWVGRASAPFVETGEERAGFDYTLAIATRESLFLRATVPQLAGLQVMALAVVVNLSTLDAGALTFGIPFYAGLALFVAPTAFETGQFGKDAKARWLFGVAPLASFDRVLHGGVKALVAFSFLPTMAVAVVVLTALGGPTRIPAIVLAIELTLFTALYFARRWSFALPFTKLPGKNAASTKNIGPVFGMLLAMGAVVGVHLLLTLHWIATVVAAAALVPLLVQRYRALHELTLAEPPIRDV